ncbi:MAG: radical SAM protein [Desulfuromonadales bacterium]|nr:radical SAM protein [Desulfuromonadales bacterium]MBN2792425.1 radical SAM protein [Desulfuromonadales bacterium]
MASTCPMMKIKPATDHPCFGGDHNKSGRVHLPVAPGCNIKCGFCERKYDCVNESRPGITSKVLTPEQGVKRVQLVKDFMSRQDGPSLKVVGIAGPGDPLANPKTFETFKLVRQNFPEMKLCLSTNGLRLPDYIDQIVEVGVTSLTITMNALTAETGAKVYEWVDYGGKRLSGVEGAELLLEKQLAGLHLAAQSGLMVKINHVYIPGVNDHETLDLAVKVRELGADMLNIMPVIPIGLFKEVEPPSEMTIELVRNQAELILSQARHCKQCRADAAGLIGQDIDLEQLESNQLAG